jgi:hypothetical protein
MTRTSVRRSRGGPRRQPSVTAGPARARRRAPAGLSVDQSGGESVDKNHVNKAP